MFFLYLKKILKKILEERALAEIDFKFFLFFFIFFCVIWDGIGLGGEPGIESKLVNYKVIWLIDNLNILVQLESCFRFKQ